MILFFRLLLILNFLGLSYAYSIPGEGLNEKNESMPKAVKDSWDSTFVILFGSAPSYYIGTGVLIKVKELEFVTELYFLTANHVIQNDCPSNGMCSAGTITQDIQLHDRITESELKSTQGLIFKGFEIIKRSSNPDMALLKVTIIKDKKIEYPHPIKISKNCSFQGKERLYGIGFSDPVNRFSAEHKAISDRDFVHKRWSQGYALEELNFDLTNGTNTLIGTTVDVISGGSGGPLINSNGEIQGIAKAVRTTENDKYVGNETPGSEDWYSLMVGCKELNDFIPADEVTSCR